MDCKCRGPLRFDKTLVEDSHYVGQFGHSLGECFECFCDSCMKRRYAFARWDKKGGALFLAISFKAQGFTQKESARMAGISLSTLKRQLKKFRENPKLLSHFGL